MPGSSYTLLLDYQLLGGDLPLCAGGAAELRQKGERVITVPLNILIDVAQR